MIRFVRGKIRITEIPPGPAPVWVRSGWVGAIVSVVAVVDVTDIKGILKGQTLPRAGQVYCAHQFIALNELYPVCCTAEDWLLKHRFSQSHIACFCFPTTSAEIVGELEETTGSVKYEGDTIEIMLETVNRQSH